MLRRLVLVTVALGSAAPTRGSLTDAIVAAEDRRWESAIWSFRDLSAHASALESALPSIKSAVADAVAWRTENCSCSNPEWCSALSTPVPTREILG